MSFFTEETLAKLDAAADSALDRLDDIARREAYGRGDRTPPGMVRLDTPAKKQLWMKHLRQQAANEQEAFAPGDIANAALEHPAVQTAFEAQGEA